MLSARSVMGMGGWSRIPRGGGASRRSQREACARWRRQPRRTLCAHVNTCDHGALGTGGMGTAAHAATRMVEHTAAGGQERTEGSVCAVSTCVRVGGHQGPTWQVLRRDTSRAGAGSPGRGQPHTRPTGPACGQPSCPSLTPVTVGDSVTWSLHRARGWSGYGRMTRKNPEREAEIRREMGRQRQERHPVGCRTGTGGHGGRDRAGPVGGKTGVEGLGGEQSGGWEERREIRVKKGGRRWGEKKWEETDTEARVAPELGKLT